MKSIFIALLLFISINVLANASSISINYEKPLNKIDESIKQDILDSNVNIAHLFIFEYEIPVLGKEEDASDELANILLLEYYDHGAQVTQNAAELFLLE